MRVLVAVTVPVQTVSELNRRDHWAKKHRRTRSQKDTALLVLRTARVVDRQAMVPPYVVRLVRIAPRPIHDFDNLLSGMKAVRDAVAHFLGVSDADLLGRGDVRWLVEQEGGPDYAVRIEIGKEVAIDASLGV
jgi:hypothetical protein